MALSLPTIKLAVYAGDKLVSESTFQRDVINIGKMARSHLRLDDENVSRMHSAIEVTRSGTVEVADLGSTNGTFVNGQRITRKELVSGDEIAIGNTRLVLEIIQAEQSRPSIRARRPAKLLPALKVYDQTAFLEEPAPEFGTNRLALEAALVWGNTALASDVFERPQTITVGDSKHAILPFSPHAEGDVYPLVLPSGSGFALNLAREFEGQIRIRDEVRDLKEIRAEMGATIPFAPDMRARIEVGRGFVVLLGYQELAPKPKTAFLSRISFAEQVYLALSLIAHVAFMIMLSLIPEEQLIASRDPYARKNVLIQAIQVAEEEKKDEVEETLTEEEEREREFEVEQEELVEDIQVEEEKPKERFDVAEKEKKKERDLLSKLTPEERKKYNREKVQNLGLNKILNDTSLMADLTKPGTDLLGLNTEELKTIASKNPNAALSTLNPFSGDVSAGGPAGDGGFQVPLDSVGGGGGPGGDRGVIAGLDKSDSTGGDRRLGKVSGISEKKSKVKVDVLSPEVSEGYPRDVVRRVIRSHMGQIKWCYQKALQLDPELGGKVVLAFLIQPNGGLEAPKIAQNTMGEESVGECIANKSRRWKFPPPPNGMVVKVRYPFLFKAK